MRRTLLGLLACVVLFAAAGGARHAAANGVPQVVKLAYLDGVSNYGPKDAEGVLEITFAEAHARVDVKRLPAQEGFTYEGWLSNAEGKTLFVGKIPVDASGVGALETKLAGLDRYDYNLFVVAARAEADPASVMPKQRSIAGRFTVIQDQKLSANGGQVRPGTLPETGEAAAGDNTWQRIAFTLCVMAAASGVALVAIRQIQRMRRASR
jgi:hypothetical protein